MSKHPSNLRMFARSLRRHPGLAMCWAMPGLGLFAAAMHSPQEHFAERATAAFIVGCAITWIPVLITAWTGRKQYADEVTP